MGVLVSKTIKTPVIVRDSYTIYLELFRGIFWFHTDVRQWSKSVKKLFINDLELLNKEVSFPIKALVTESNKKLAKFGDATNWKVEKQIVLDNGEIAYIYSWSK